MGLLNRLRGEEPGYFKKLSVQWREGTGGLGEFLTKYARAVARSRRSTRGRRPHVDAYDDIDAMVQAAFNGDAKYPHLRLIGVRTLITEQ